MAMMPASGDPCQPDRRPMSIGEILAEGMSRVDGCPNCDNTQPADAAIPTPPCWHWTTHHKCADCGTTWTRDWKD